VELSQSPLSTDYQATGRFWVPGAPEQTWWGEVRFRPGEAVRVTLADTPWRGSQGKAIEVPVFHGQLSDGAPCSVVDGRASQGPFGQQYAALDPSVRSVNISPV
jgi:hypothetical protein